MDDSLQLCGQVLAIPFDYKDGFGRFLIVLRKDLCLNPYNYNEKIQKAMGDVSDYDELPEWLRPNLMPTSAYRCSGLSVKKIFNKTITPSGEPQKLFFGKAVMLK